MKYALLDTDFISKGYAFSVDDEHHLIDRIIAMPEYEFICHEQVIRELKRHDSHAPAWMEERIREGRIKKYTDAQILEEMTLFYKDIGLYMYTQFLKNACEAFDSGFFKEYFGELSVFDHSAVTLDDYLVKLRTAETKIGEGRNLGEIKTYVLLQWLNIQRSEQLYYFCSDDKNARNGILVFDDININCITLVSSLLRIHIETGESIPEIEPYIKAMLAYFSAHDQKTIRVIEASPVGRFESVACEQVLNEIFEDKFIELANGFLKYKS